ncbi:hypothetical protein [Actinoplanes sp. GCM10030250]|uniref:hypothetical protein n=1 Tax=Actinoplanes sp. GCM10030250 TaxID=3273376 RepID=UPI0036221043
MPDQTSGPDHTPAHSRRGELVPYRRPEPPRPEPRHRWWNKEWWHKGQHGWQEHVAPAAVILLGVLAVVAFGLVVRAHTADNPDPAVAPPIVVPTAAQVPIPLPSASPSPSVRPVNSIIFERGSVPEVVNLPAEGTSDWVHWGEQGKYALERKEDGGFAILEGTPGSPRTRDDAGPDRYRWTGGSPLGTAKNVTSGIRLCGAGDGFTLSAPAGTVISTLKLYVGVGAGQGLLQMELSTGGEVVTDRITHRGSGITTASYTVNYRATGTGKISVKWITEESYGEDCGGVVLYAAALS